MTIDNSPALGGTPAPAITRPSTFGRRGFLAATGAFAAGGAVSVGSPLLAHADPADEVSRLLANWREYLTGGSAIDPADPAIAARLTELDTEVGNLLATLTAGADRTELWPDLPLTGTNREKSLAMVDNLTRLATIATAFATNGSAYQADAATAERVVDALRWINAAMFSHGDDYQDGSWYQWEVSGPERVSRACVLLGDAIPREDVTALIASIDSWSPDPSRIEHSDNPATGANLVWKCRTAVLTGLLQADGDEITHAASSLTPVFGYVTSGDGFYRDGSFIQHVAFPYTGGYGAGLAVTLIPLLGLLAGSTWDIDDPEKDNVYRWVHDSFAPFMINGAIMDSVRGRMIANPARSDHVEGHKVIEIALRAAGASTGADREAFRSMAKTWITQDHYLDFMAGASLAVYPFAAEVLADDSIAPWRPRRGFHGFPGMDRAVHHRPGFAVSLALSSKRIRNYESTGTNTNMHGWYTANGMTYLYTDDLGHYADAFWPTVDPYRLPGTTVDSVPRANAQGRNYTSAFDAVGFAELDGCGAAMMHLAQDPRHGGSTLQAKKSWFLLGDRIVALGAGITSISDYAVETTIENRNLHSDGTPRLVVDGDRQPVEPGWSSDFDGARWAHLEGVGGYLFPQRATVRALREDRTGRWTDIYVPNSPDDPVTRRYQTLWFDHGVAPTDESYAYVLVPGATARRTAELADDPGLEILANNAAGQSVRWPGRGITAANLWTPGTVGVLTLEAPSAPDLPTVIVDDKSPEFQIRSGDWSTSTDTEGKRYEGQHHFHREGDGSAVARFSIQVPATGTYAVEAWWVEHDNRATNTPFVIRHAGGETAVRMNQRFGHGSGWSRLGVFEFSAGEDYYVEVSDDANGIVIADAVRLRPVTDEDPWAASILMRERAGVLKIGIADPTQQAQTLHLTIDRARYRRWTGDDTITVHQKRSSIRISVDTRQAHGATHHITFRRS